MYIRVHETTIFRYDRNSYYSHDTIPDIKKKKI